MSDLQEAPVDDESQPPSPAEAEALQSEQAGLDAAIQRAQVEYLTARVAELARENARLRAGVGN